MVKWKASDVEKLTGNKIKPRKRHKLIPKKEPKGLQYIKSYLFVLKEKNIISDFVTELQFHPKRKFRFDVAIPEMKLAIEYEGLNSEKSGHTTLLGYTSDCEKYNLAQLSGWKVLRYTAKNFPDIATDLKFLENGKA